MAHPRQIAGTGPVVGALAPFLGGVRGETDGIRAQRRLPDVLLIAAEPWTVVLGAAQHEIRRPVGVDVGLAAQVALEVVPVFPEHEWHHVKPACGFDELPLFGERFEEAVLPPPVLIEHAQGKGENPRMRVGLHGQEKHAVFEAIVLEAVFRGVFHEKRNALAVQALGPLHIIRHLEEHLRGPVFRADGEKRRAHVAHAQLAGAENQFGDRAGMLA